MRVELRVYPSDAQRTICPEMKVGPRCHGFRAAAAQQSPLPRDAAGSGSALPVPSLELPQEWSGIDHLPSSPHTAPLPPSARLVARAGAQSLVRLVSDPIAARGQAAQRTRRAAPRGRTAPASGGPVAAQRETEETVRSSRPTDDETAQYREGRT